MSVGVDVRAGCLVASIPRAPRGGPSPPRVVRRPAPLRWAQSAHLPLMADERIRRQIAFLAAQLMYQRTESEYFTAKRKAAKQLGVEYRFRPADLPSNREIRDQIQAMARMHEGPKRLDTSATCGSRPSG